MADQRQHNDSASRATVDTDNEDVTKRKGFAPRLLFALLLLSFGSASQGFASSIIATTLSQPSFYISMNLVTAKNAAALVGATNALFYTGGALGALSSGYIVHRYGRKKSAGIAALIILISSAVLAGSVHIAMFIVFRFCQGWGTFQMFSTIPTWMSELVPPAKRGALVQIHPSMINFGYVAASYTGVGFFYLKDSNNNQWRGPLALAGLFPVLLLLGYPWLPESPRFLVANDKLDEAWKILQRLHADTHDPQDVFAKKELYQIQQQTRLEQEQRHFSISGTYIEIFRRPTLRKRAFIVMFLTFMQMSSGALVMNSKKAPFEIREDIVYRGVS